MKRIFYSGLLALTIAFGVTSCDKNDVGEVNGPLTQVTKGITSKVSFGEITGIKVKGAKNEAGKTAGEFDHIYSSVAQSIAIADGDGAIVFSGSYEAGNIAGGITADEGYNVPIILQNGSYRAETMNEGGAGIGYLPYSSSADFVLNSDTGVIALQASLGAGFLIVNVEDALEGQRVTGTTVARQASGDGGVAGDVISLLEDAEFGDFYGYLPSESYTVVASYNLDGTSTPISASQFIAPGTAYTIELNLDGDTPAVVGSIVSTSTLDGLESEIRDGAGLDVNDDGDLLDSIQRVITSTQATLNDENDGEPVVTDGPWYVIGNVDIDVSVTTATVTSTEAAESLNVNPDSDTDMYDTIQKIVTTTTTTTTDQADVSNSVDGEWTIVGDYSSAGFGEGTTPADGTQDPADTLSAFSEWSPLTAAVDVATIDQTRTRTVVQNGDLDATAPVGDLSESRTIDNPDYVAPVDPIDTYTYSDFSGTAPAAVVENGAWSPLTAAADVATIDQTRSAVSVVAAHVLTREATIVQNGDLDSPAPPTEALTQNVPESRNALDDETRTIDNPNYAAPAAAWEVSDAGVHSNSDYPSYTFTIDEDPLFGSFGYILSTDGVAADAIIGEYDTAAEAITAGQAAIALL